MTDETWREGPPAALRLMVFRQTCDGLEPVEIPAHLTLETIGQWLKAEQEIGAIYTVLSVGTKDVFEMGDALVHVESIVY